MTSTEYLESAKIEELAAQLEKEGYQVAVGTSGREDGYDLVAERGAERLAYEVTAGSRLGSSAQEIQVLRSRARDQGYGFRLVVVNPPREKKVEVAGLADQIRQRLLDEPPAELRALSRNTRVQRVAQLEVESAQVMVNGIRVKGDGVVEVELEYDIENGRGVADWSTDFPLYFDLLLDRDLHIEQVYDLRVNTSSFDE
jgi:hypothetical protein